VILLYSEAFLRGSSNLGRTNCSGRGTGALNLGLTMIFEGSMFGSLGEWMALSWFRRRKLHLRVLTAWPMKLHRPPPANGIRTASRGRPLATRP
jgi:hypothetical protein